MLTTKNSGTGIRWFLAALSGVVFLGGCTLSGPEVLLQGERLIHDGKYADAIARLKLAVQLLPENGQAWNHLGIAYHSAGDLKEADRAYRTALRRNPNLAVVHFNLGTLSLDQNNPQAAVGELTIYTVLERDSVEGWLKLGTAQLRARQFDSAEKSFQTVLRLKPGLTEGVNGLGVVNAQRRRVREAITFFSNALKAQPNYAPALLNLAVVMQPFDRAGALHRYKGYLALAPGAPNAQAVRELVQQLESESSPAPRMAVTNRIPASVPQLTNTIPSDALSSLPPTNTYFASSQTNTTLTKNLPPTNSLATAAVTTAHTKPVKGAEQLALVQRMPKPDAPPAGSTAPTPKREVPTEKPQEALVPNNPAPKAPIAVAPVSPPAAAEIRAPSDNADSKSEADRKNAADIALDTASTAPEEKRTFVQRLNPATWFRGKDKPVPITTPLDSSPRIKSTPLPPSAPAEKEKSFARADGVTRVPSTTESKRSLSAPAPVGDQPAQLSIPRYTFLSPKRPGPGDRAQAQQALARGVLAHSQRQLTTALGAYREAVRLDPSLFEAQYNLGLAAYELKDWPLALSSYETALSINPTSANTRFNFALALDRAGYTLDSAAQLEKMLTEHPQEGRAHFSVAKIYAEQLKQNDAAALHYRRLLELEPQHPQAIAIRQWLVAHAAVQ